MTDSVDSILDSGAKTPSANPANQYTAIKASIASLQEALLNAHPTMPGILKEIHNNLKNDPAVVTLLEEDEIRIIVQGLEKQTDTYLASSLTKTSAAKTKALSKSTLSDLGF